MPNRTEHLQSESDSAIRREERRDFVIEEMARQIERLEQRVTDMSKERDTALKSGIVALGMALVGMGVWIFNLFIAGKLH